MRTPTVSILIPTFNRAHYVGDAIASALAQTLTDTEVIVVDDGSTDATPELVARISDTRLRYVRHDANRGIPETRNTALASAQGQYIAWLDSDDTARPTRLQKQINFLRDNPGIAMVGSAAGKMNIDGSPKRGIRMPPLNPPIIAAWLLFRSAFQQSSVTGRADILRAYRYDPRYHVCEDVDMFVRLQRDHDLANLPQVLIDRRLHPEQTVRQFRGEILTSRQTLIQPMLASLRIDATTEDVERHVLLGFADLRDADVDENFLVWARDWLARLHRANDATQVFEKDALATASDYFWLLACRALIPKIGRTRAIKAFVTRLPTNLLGSNTRQWVRSALPTYLSGATDRRSAE
jgi:glycosyltransferase involved in cell wall biosynthesis